MQIQRQNIYSRQNLKPLVVELSFESLFIAVPAICRHFLRANVTRHQLLDAVQTLLYFLSLKMNKNFYLNIATCV